MSAQQLQVKDAGNATQNLSVNQDPTNSNALVGATSITDPLTGNKAQVAAFHNTDNQNPGSTAYGILSGGVAQLLNVSGNLDRQRETGADGVPAVGISSSAANFAMQFKGSVAAAITANAAAQAVTPSAMSGTIGGVAWAIQVGSVIIIDSGANKESVVVTAVTAATFSAIFAKSHAINTSFIGFVYNQERDAAGEADGATGIGTAVAAEYEFNGGAPGNANFDRARSVQAKGRTMTAINTGGGQNSTSLNIGAAGTLKAGMQVLAYKASTFPAAGSYEVVYVDFSYVEGTTTVPLATAIVGTPIYDTIAYDSFSATGPGLNGFSPTGVGIEEEALYDPVSGLFYLERAATQDAMPPQNVVAENGVLWNGTTMDRMRSAVSDAMATTGIAAEAAMLWNGTTFDRLREATTDALPVTGIALEAPAFFNGTTFDRARSAAGSLGVAAINSEGFKTTFRVAAVALAPAATATDILALVGSATKTLRVKRVVVTGLATAAATLDLLLIKRTAANTGGTSTAPGIAQHDSGDAAATGTVAQYSANPTGLGAGANIGVQKLNLGAAGAAGQIVWDFSIRNDKPVVLRGIAQALCLNLNGQAIPAGTSLDYEIEWEEDNS